jgi:cell wall assembly regulator SMI1
LTVRTEVPFGVPGCVQQDDGVWRELIARLEPDAAFAPGATEADLVSVEAALGAALPGDLRGCLSETDGVEGSHGLG